jgi:hypothetical protein
MMMKTLPTIIESKHPKKEGGVDTMNKMEGPKTKEPPKKANNKGNIKFPNPLLLREAYQIRKWVEVWCYLKYLREGIGTRLVLPE